MEDAVFQEVTDEDLYAEIRPSTKEEEELDKKLSEGKNFNYDAVEHFSKGWLEQEQCNSSEQKLLRKVRDKAARQRMISLGQMKLPFEPLKMSSFRQLEQRYISVEVSLMEWNPILDLIALASVTGEIFLHRLSWQKVWSIPYPGNKDENVSAGVTAMSWRPDGKILAYAYADGKVTLCDVENSETVHSFEAVQLFDVQCVVTSLNWVQAADRSNADQAHFYTDRSAEFLQKLYAYNKAYGTSSKQVEEVADDFKKMKGQKNLNILAVGMETGKIHLHSFGMFPTGNIDLSTGEKDVCRVLSVTLSSDFQILTVILQTKDELGHNCYLYKSFSVPLLYENMNEMKIVALKYGQIYSLLTYLCSTIRAISEAWEDILLEVDTKIHNYAVEKGNLSEGSISDDFLELLMFGNPSDSLEKFLLHDLTESGLKKFGHTIEHSYSNIQKLVLKRLQNVASSLFYHLNDLKGMALWHEKFGALGLSESAVNEAVLSVGSFLLKAIEIQQVIDNSMKNFKAFFRWLYSVILRLSDEPIPFEIGKLTQQDLQFVAEFLKENFTFDDESKKQTVKLERVAQYLKKEDLAYPATTSGNPWIKFLQDHPTWKETGIVFPYHPEKSLISQYTDLRQTVEAAFKGTWSVMKNTIQEKVSHVLYKIPAPCSDPYISHVSCPESGFLYTIVTSTTPPCDYFYLIRESSNNLGNIEIVMVEFNEMASIPTSSQAASNKLSYKILDVKFYTKETITVLLIETFRLDFGCPVLLQLPLRPLCPKMISHPRDCEIIEKRVPLVDGGQFVEKNSLKRLENIKASSMAVSGSRKVVCVLFASKRQVRLFEMDVDEDEDDEAEGDHEDSVMKDSSMEESAFDVEGDSEKPKDV